MKLLLASAGAPFVCIRRVSNAELHGRLGVLILRRPRVLLLLLLLVLVLMLVVLARRLRHLMIPDVP